MTATKPKTLAEVQVGDEVAEYRGDEPQRIRTVEAIGNFFISCGKHSKYDRASGELQHHAKDHTGVFIRPATDEDRAEIARREREAKAEHQRQQNAHESPELETCREICAALSDEYQKPTELYALAQRIGLSKLQDFAAAIRKAQETT